MMDVLMLQDYRGRTTGYVLLRKGEVYSDESLRGQAAYLVAYGVAQAIAPPVTPEIEAPAEPEAEPEIEIEVLDAPPEPDEEAGEEMISTPAVRRGRPPKGK